MRIQNDYISNTKFAFIQCIPTHIEKLYTCVLIVNLTIVSGERLL